MAIAPGLRAQILRLYQAERWRVGTIASQLNLHRDTVKRVLEQACVMRAQAPLRSSLVDPYLPFMVETLTKFPTLTASRLYAMVRSRGYTGGADHFRHIVASHRPRPAAQAYLRLRTLAGEQAQVDWAHFGHLVIGRAKRPLMAFVMVLSYSRRIFLRFSLNARMDSFLRGHVLAFAAFGGVPRVLLYDNLKSAVIERVDHPSGCAIRFNTDLLAFAGAHRYEPRPVAVARDNFFAARIFTDLDDLNAQAQAWCEGPASDRPWPENTRLTVRQAFTLERPSLMNLPEHDYPVAERVEVHAGKTPYVRFDLNDYSIPHTHVRCTLTVLAEPECIRVLDGAAVLATHLRSWDRGAQIEQEAHVQDLVAHKRAARAHRATDRLTQAVPALAELLQRAAARGHNLGSVTLGLSKLLDRYGAKPMQAAVTEALARDVPHPNAVRLALERAREATQAPPPVDTPLSERARLLDVVVQAHALDAYDALYTADEQTATPTQEPTTDLSHPKDSP